MCVCFIKYYYVVNVNDYNINDKYIYLYKKEKYE